jgi:hypothetical protein
MKVVVVQSASDIAMASQNGLVDVWLSVPETMK